ncbi:MAG: glycosyltransferase family 39 protein [Planctomycetes bacterium]|nr:glycosyltransferase family 39 protein [Planctomycetota bacterium]
MSAERAWTWGVLALALALRLAGIGWCLPAPGRPLSYVPDESTLFLILERMQEAGHPVAEGGSYQTPLHPILVGGLCKALSWTGVLHLPASREEAAADPGILAPLYVVGRSLSLAMALATVWAVIRFGTFLWKDARAGVTAGALVAMAPAHIVQSHLNLFNVPAALWWTLAAWAGARGAEAPTKRSAAAMGLAFGAAVGTKLSCALALPALVLALWRGRATGRIWATFAACAAFAGVLSFPPLVTDPSGVLEMFSRIRSAHGVGEVPPILARCAMLGKWMAWGWGPPLLVAAVAGSLRRDTRLPYLLAHLLPIPAAILLARGGSLALLIPAIPFAALAAAPVVARPR